MFGDGKEFTPPEVANLAEKEPVDIPAENVLARFISLINDLATSPEGREHLLSVARIMIHLAILDASMANIIINASDHQSWLLRMGATATSFAVATVYSAGKELTRDRSQKAEDYQIPRSGTLPDVSPYHKAGHLVSETAAEAAGVGPLVFLSEVIVQTVKDRHKLGSLLKRLTTTLRRSQEPDVQAAMAAFSSSSNDKTP